MKQRNKSISKQIYGAKLFREDLDEILNRCKDHSVSIGVSDDDYNYESLYEVAKQRGSRTSYLEFRGKTVDKELSSDYLTIRFYRSSVLLHLDGVGDFRSLGYEIVELLKNRVRWHYKFFNPFIWVPFWFVLVQVWMALQEKKLENDKYSWLGWVTLSVTIIAAFSYLDRHFNFRPCLISKREYGFFNRNKDQIILLVIGALIGALLTYFIERITK